MIESRNSAENQDKTISSESRILEARYAYYRRCREFKLHGEQCKAPAMKGEHTCYSHAAQRDMANRREAQRRAVLEEVVRQMRRRGKPEFQTSDIFMDFNSIQVTLAVMAQALIDGRIDCKTAGRLAVQVQTMAKLLRMSRRLTAETWRRGEKPGLARIYADDRGWDELRTAERAVAEAA